MKNDTIESHQDEIPILGNNINGNNEPFSDLYLLDFPEWYEVE